MARVGAKIKKGKPSIESYALALEDARAAGAAVYPMRDDASIERWRQMRNAAAHEPGTFTKPSPGGAAYSATRVAGELSLIDEWLRRTAPLAGS